MTMQRKDIQNLFDENISELFSPVEVGSEVGKVCVELLIALGLLSNVSIPLAAGFSFIGVATKAVKLIHLRIKKKLTLDECVKIVSVLAYIESFKEILKIGDNQDLLVNLSNNSIPSNFLKQTKKFELREDEVEKAVICFRETQLAQDLNGLLSSRLQIAGLDKQQADIFAQRVAWNSQRYMKKVLVEVANNQYIQIQFYINNWLDELEKYQSIDDNLERQINKRLSQKVFKESFTCKDIYVPLKAQLLDNNGQRYKNKSPVDLEDWTKKLLQAHDKQEKVIFIQGYPGRGKSLFCLMFANWVKQNLHPLWTPILIRLRDIETVEKQFENTLKSVVKADFAANDNGWLTDRNTRYLFLLDGFDELVMEGRNSGLEDFLRQVGRFQEDCQQNMDERGHRILITGRTLALQTIDRLMPRNLERVEILPMNEEIQETWLNKWESFTDKNKARLLKDFLKDKNCPDAVKELAKEPLLLYLLAAMQRDKELNLNDIFEDSRTETQIRIYEKTLNWLLTEQRPQ